MSKKKLFLYLFAFMFFIFSIVRFVIDLNLYTGERIIQGASVFEIKCLRLLGADIHFTDPGGTTLLMVATRYENMPVTEYFLSQNVYVNAKNERNETAMFEAIGNGDLNLIKILFKYGAKRFDETFNGNTYLHANAYTNDTNILNYLLDQGYNPNILNQRGESPLFIAFMESGSEEYIHILINQTNKDNLNKLIKQKVLSHHLGPETKKFIIPNEYVNLILNKIKESYGKQTEKD